MFGHQSDNQDESKTDDRPSQETATSHEPITESFNPALPTPSAPASDTTVTPTDNQIVKVSTAPSSATNDLLDIKQQALNQLSPLVGHLEQTPEEKFRTTMMMIQATDNQDLVKDAYAAAQAITDEKAKAQALLDIVNEINYFTQQHSA